MSLMRTHCICVSLPMQLSTGARASDLICVVADVVAVVVVADVVVDYDYYYHYC